LECAAVRPLTASRRPSKQQDKTGFRPLWRFLNLFVIVTY